MAELLPCPFCGSVPLFQMVNDTGGGHVICTSCGSVGPLGANEQDATEKWNVGDEHSRPGVNPDHG